MYQSTTITLNNMGSWLNNVNNMLNANNLTTVTDISEESQKSSNNNTFTIDDIDTAVQDELVQDELRQLNNPGSQSGSPPSGGGQAGAQPPSK